MNTNRMTNQDLHSESTENLIEYIRWKNDADYAETAKEAFRVFTFRFQVDLQKKIIPICKNWGYDEQVASEIAYMVFDRVWKYPTFTISKAKLKEFDTAVRLYLYRIAGNLLADYKKSFKEVKNPFTGDEQIIREFPDIENFGLEKEKKASLLKKMDIIKKALDCLTPKHKIIYLTYKQYESEMNGQFKMPRKLLENLRRELDLTQSTIRVYKKEAFDIVESSLKIYGSR